MHSFKYFLPISIELILTCLFLKKDTKVSKGQTTNSRFERVPVEISNTHLQIHRKTRYFWLHQLSNKKSQENLTLILHNWINKIENISIVFIFLMQFDTFILLIKIIIIKLHMNVQNNKKLQQFDQLSNYIGGLQLFRTVS